MTEWDERTEAIPGKKDDKSIEIDLDLALAPGTDVSEAPPVTAFLDAPGLVVFEPIQLGIAPALTQLGYRVRVGNTGVDVMSLVAAATPAAVLCAPGPDNERRRMLAAALRLRFPQVPIVYVSTHAGQEDAVLGAIREGARAVLAWPLPPEADVKRVLAPYVTRAMERADDPDTALNRSPFQRVMPHMTPHAGTPAPSLATRGPTPITAVTSAPAAPVSRDMTGPSRAKKPASDEVGGFDELETAVVPLAQMRPSRLPSDAMKPLPAVQPDDAQPPRRMSPPPVPLPVARADESLLGGAPIASRVGHEPVAFQETTTELTAKQSLPPANGAALADDDEREDTVKRGELGDLLDAVSPFLWSLEDACHWAEQLGASGDPIAQMHARTLKAVVRVLGQVHARIEESGA